MNMHGSNALPTRSSIARMLQCSLTNATSWLDDVHHMFVPSLGRRTLVHTLAALRMCCAPDSVERCIPHRARLR